MRKNYSGKRQQIYAALRGTRAHPSADALYTALLPNCPGLSIATVYRNLRDFCADGRARSLGVIDGKERFDADVRPHSHFVCERCGAVLDVPVAVGNASLAELEAREGHHFTSCEVVFRGVCKQCRVANNEKSTT